MSIGTRSSALLAGLVLVAATAATLSSTGDAASASAPGRTPHLARAGFATTIGQTSGSPLDCGPTGLALFATVEDGAPSYVVPAAGVLTSVSYRAGVSVGTGFQALVLAPTGSPTSRALLARSPVLPAVASTLTSYPVRIPVPAGAVLGLRTTTNNMACVIGGAPTDTFASTVVDDTATQLTGLTTHTGLRPDISAVWESDDDGDGYGDATQDACPQSALAHDPCPAPETVLAKKPKKRSTHHKVTVTFVASLPGSTFTCSLDAKPAKPCGSPYRAKVRAGKHTIVVTAVSPAGIADPTPASVRFKVTAKRTR